MVLVFTDGRANGGGDLSEAADMLHDKATVIAVGIGDDVDISELDEIASDPTFVVLEDSYTDLLTNIHRITRKACFVPEDV
jgi:hypothetical protein